VLRRGGSGGELIGLAIGVGALALGFLFELIAILRLNSGHFTYTLDDPYIHLALAQRIGEGLYGINPGEPSAPSSSILWPFLLVPAARAGILAYLPLLIGIVSGFATVAVFHRFLKGSVLAETSGQRPVLASVFVVLLVLATNLIGVPFTGTEHSLQVLLAALVVLGLVREAETGKVPPWLVPAIAAGPLIRYESLAIAVAAVLYLLLRRHRRSAVLATALALVPIGAFSAFLKRLGLGFLPTPVLAKAPLFSPDEPVPRMLAGLRTALRDPSGVLLALAGVWMLSIALVSNRPQAERFLAGCIALAVGLHAFAGRYGGYHRYELYMVVAVLLTVLYLERRAISDAIVKRPVLRVAAIAGVLCVVLSSRYLFGLTTIPAAANNIYEQQYQMHRFAVDFERAPVAVNDLGYVSFGNRHYVLDLEGLGSPGFRSQPDGTRWSEWLERAAKGHGIQAAMIYDKFYEDLPQTWRKVGELRLSRPRITPALERVSFYATSEVAYPRVRERVDAFRRTLPPNVHFEFVE
jgi:hypothetical protein